MLRRDMHAREPILKVQDIQLNPASQTVWKRRRELKLTRKEYHLLEFFMRHPGYVISQEKLLEHVWGSTANPMTNSVRMHIQTLRKKLDKNHPYRYIVTVNGEGYRLLEKDPKTEKNPAIC